MDPAFQHPGHARNSPSHRAKINPKKEGTDPNIQIKEGPDPKNKNNEGTNPNYNKEKRSGSYNKKMKGVNFKHNRNEGTDPIRN